MEEKGKREEKGGGKEVREKNRKKRERGKGEGELKEE